MEEAEVAGEPAEEVEDRAENQEMDSVLHFYCLLALHKQAFVS